MLVADDVAVAVAAVAEVDAAGIAAADVVDEAAVEDFSGAGAGGDAVDDVRLSQHMSIQTTTRFRSCLETPASLRSDHDHVVVDDQPHYRLSSKVGAEKEKEPIQEIPSWEMRLRHSRYPVVSTVPNNNSKVSKPQHLHK
jgi:Cys-tRNA synthase (O-phospho-L-seryl-tRNA:Cys-tRNA synthase)